MALTEYNLETLKTYHPKDLDEDTLFSVRRQNYLKACDLVKAVGANDVEEVKKLLCCNDVSAEKVEFRKWYVNEKGLDDWIALHAAAEVGSLVLTQLLIDCGSRINEVSDVTYTPLHIAATGDHDDIVEILLKNGADPRIWTEACLYGTALHYAVGHNAGEKSKQQYQCIKLLTDAAGSEDLVNDLSGDDCTALYYAVLGGLLDNVKLLVERGAKMTINSADGDGLTALHQAAVCGYLEITKHLVEVGGADIFLTANYGQTPYACAAPKKHHNAERQKDQAKVMEYLDRKMKETQR